MNNNTIKLTSSSILVGIGLGVAFWVTKSTLDSIYLKSDFIELLLYPNLYELLVRSIVIITFVSFCATVSISNQWKKKLAQERKNLDITVKQRTEVLSRSLSTLEAANLQLQETDRYKSRIISKLSYEVRPPLNTLLGFTELLKSKHYGPLNDKQLTYVEHIEESGNNLLAISNDLQDIAKIDMGQMEANLEPIFLDKVLHSVMSIMTLKFHMKGLTSEVKVEDLLNEPVIGDEKICGQILLNLLSNAVKLTPEDGKVVVQAVVENEWVKVSVSYTGNGIPVDQEEMTFSEFYQVGDSSGKVQEGIGIRIALTHRLAELLEGKVEFESEPSKGSTFTFTFPYRRPAVALEKDEPVKEHIKEEATEESPSLLKGDNGSGLAS